jgi:MFS family permease
MIEARRSGAGYGDALRSREFRALSTGQAVSITGGSVASVALTILVYRRTGSPFLSSLTFALGFLPYLLSGALLSGLVDRVRPRRLVNACDLASGAVAGLMAIPGMPVPALLGLLFVLGTFSSIAGGARAALVRSTVSEAAYVPARSLLKIASQSAQVGGNAVGGALVVALGTRGAILFNAVSFLFAFAIVRTFVANYAIPGVAGRLNLVRDSLGGIREILGRPELARLLLLGWLVPMFSVVPEALAAPYVSARHGSATLVGWWLCALPAGTIVGDIIGVRFASATLQRRLVFVAAGVSFVPYLVFAGQPSVSLAIALLAVSGLCGMYSLGLDARVRDAAPARLFPRAMALNQAGLMTLQGTGFAVGGALAEWIGSAHAIAVAGCCGVAVVLALVVVPGRLRPIVRVAA